MSKKLTLRVPEELIDVAKQMARERNTSVSRMVSTFFRALQNRSWRSKELTPVLRRVTGVMDDIEHEEYHRHLEEKYMS